MHTKSPNYLSYEEFCELRSKAVLRTVHHGHVCYRKRMYKIDGQIAPETPALREGDPVKVFLDPTGLNGGTLHVESLDGHSSYLASPATIPMRRRFGVGKVAWRFTRNAA